MDKEALKSEAKNFLNEQMMGVIATIGQDNTPEAASVNYLLDENWVLYIITDKDTRKVQNLRQNSKAAFVVGNTAVPHTVQIQGNVEIVEDSNPAYEELRKKLVDSKRLINDPMYDMFGHNYVILKFTISWMRWLAFDQSNGSPIFTELIP